jgi:hypothetical protein
MKCSIYQERSLNFAASCVRPTKLSAACAALVCWAGLFLVATRAAIGNRRGGGAGGGNAALDPGDPEVVYISTPIDPTTDRKHEHHELFQGRSRDGGASWD